MSAPSTNSRHLAYLALLGNVTIWGAALPLTKPALSYITPAQFLLLRYILSSLILLPFLIRLIKDKAFTRKNLTTISLTESLNVIALWFVYLGLARTTALQGSLVLNTRPIITTIAGLALLSEVEEKNEWFGLGFAVLGSLLVIFTPQTQAGLTGLSTGSLFILTANILMALNVILVKSGYTKKQGNPLLIPVIGSFTGLIFYSLINLTTPLPSLTNLTEPSVLLAVLFMGILGTHIAFSLRYIGFKLIEASEATLFTYLQPLIYIPLSLFWLKETIEPYQIAGLTLIIVGVIVAETRAKTIHHLREKLFHPHIHH